MIVLGTQKSSGDLTLVHPERLLMHTLVLGQSGSGKSFFMARLLEEILLRTKARIVAIDPNGDFQTFFAPRETAFWDDATMKFKERLDNMNKLQKKASIDSFDNKRAFVKGWQSKMFQHVVAGRMNRIPLSANAGGAPLKHHWKNLHPTLQDFLLGVDPTNQPKVFQGIATCHHYILNSPGSYQKRATLRDLEEIALDFESKRLVPSLKLYGDSMTLGSEDWNRVRMQFRMVRKKFGSILYTDPLKDIPAGDTIPSDLRNYIRRGFLAPDSRGVKVWNFLSVGLAGAFPEHSLLSTYVTLLNIWQNSYHAWKAAHEEKISLAKNSLIPTGEDLGEFETNEEISNEDIEEDPVHEVASTTAIDEEEGQESNIQQRTPTFVVLDEAHNFVPEEAETPLQKMVSDLVATIAAEGRKYGIFLIISTQRPQKIRKGLVAECENLAVLKLQSSLEREVLASNTNLGAGLDARISELRQGQAVLSGRWASDPISISFGPARTFLGGAGIEAEAWIPDYVG